jgi:hypothetical protein
MAKESRSGLPRGVKGVATLAVVSLVAAMPVHAADHGPPPANQRANLKPLWSQFPLDESARGRSAGRPTTAGAKTTPEKPAQPPAARPAPAVGAGGKDATASSGDAVWLLFAGVAFVVVAAGIGWTQVRRTRPPRQPAKDVERARGLDLIVEPAAPARSPQAAELRNVAEHRLFEGSDDMGQDPRDQPVADHRAGNMGRERYDTLGTEIASVLEAARNAADDIRREAEQEAEDIRSEAARYSDEVRRRADAAAAETRAGAEGEVARIVTAAEERARRIEASAIEDRQKLVKETQALQGLLDERRRWLGEMIGTFRDVTARLEDAVHSDDESGSLGRALEPERDRRPETEYVG